jgi:5-oxoprolinase (ATP-hydrolysing) subunit A
VVAIDLNADLGESFGSWTMGDDGALFPLVSSANVACGFHAGGGLTMLGAVRLAARNGVAVGAHVSYRDLAGFGRREMEMDPAELTADVLYQLAALDGVARTAGTRVSYVKPHGALYNRIVRDRGQAQAVLDAVRAYDPTLVLLGLPGSAVLELAVAGGQPVAHEAFIDRAYRADGTLVPRREPGAVLPATAPADVEMIAARAVRLATTGEVVAADGSLLRMPVDSLCVHGDTPGAVAVAAAVRSALTDAGVGILPFAPCTRS